MKDNCYFNKKNYVDTCNGLQGSVLMGLEGLGEGLITMEGSWPRGPRLGPLRGSWPMGTPRMEGPPPFTTGAAVSMLATRLAHWIRVETRF